MYPEVTSKANVIHDRKVYHARKLRLLRRIPAQPIREVRIPSQDAIVEMISSGVFATRMTSACFQMSNHIIRQTTKELVTKRIHLNLFHLKLPFPWDIRAWVGLKVYNPPPFFDRLNSLLGLPFLFLNLANLDGIMYVVDGQRTTAPASNALFMDSTPAHDTSVYLIFLAIWLMAQSWWATVCW